MWGRASALQPGFRPAWLATALLLAALPAQARLTRLAVEQTTPVIRGHFTGELDPKDPHNAIITDIQFAPRNARGMVEYTATFALIIPAQTNGVLYYSVPNRGNGAPQAFPDGRISVVSGWQGDLIPAANRQTITVPIAKNPDGSPITGPVLERFINQSGDLKITTLTYQKPATLDSAKAQLLRRTAQNAPQVPVLAADWAFADCKTKPFPGIPDPTRICIRGGADPNSEYVLVYTAEDPLVLGIGFAATRDLNSFLRYAEKDDAGTPNPAAHKIRWAIGQGNSQSGVFIRSFINLGFNQDEANRIVWDGINPHIAARQMALNFRFAMAGGNAAPYDVGSEGIQWWSDYEDSTRHRKTAGLLDRCRATNTCPKILETFGSLEFWFLRESPDLVGTDAKADIPLPSNVRRYFFPGTTHGGGRGGFSTETPAPPTGCRLPYNPNPERETMRALDLALVDWVTKGTEPPPSRYPTLARGELVPPPTKDAPPINAVLDNDFGPDFLYNDLSGIISRQPPIVRRTIRMLVPKTDVEGQEIGGVPSVLRSVPLGVYRGWNITAGGFDKGQLCGLNGSYAPFSKAQLQQRYGTQEKYVDLVKQAAAQAVRDRFLLQEDADRLIAQAAAPGWW
jgi:hypothetical protein